MRSLLRLAALGVLFAAIGMWGRPAPGPAPDGGVARPPAGAEETAGPPESARPVPPASVADTAAAQPGPTGSDVPPVHLNSAGPAELETLPGIGPVMAARILEYRRSHGAFIRPEELRLVRGIGPRKWARLRGRVAP